MSHLGSTHLSFQYDLGSTNYNCGQNLKSLFPSKHKILKSALPVTLLKLIHDRLIAQILIF